MLMVNKMLIIGYLHVRLYLCVAKSNLPTYAIVELLIRLADINPFIGDYKGHVAYEDGVIVKTTGGTIAFTESIIVRQFHDPELISDDDLKWVAAQFNIAKQA